MKTFVVEKQKLSENISIILEKAGETKVIAVLKGNGYGLGIVPFAEMLIAQGIEFFAVAGIEEAVCLRQAGFENDILLLSSTGIKEQADLIVENNIIATVGSINSIEILDKAAKEQNKVARAHIKIDTGFGRFGFIDGEYKEAAAKIKSSVNVSVCGLFSHFSFSFGKDRKSVDRQLQLFKRAITVFRGEGIEPELIHIANSSAFLRYPDTHFNAVRIGSAFLGRLSFATELPLKKIGYLKSSITEIKILPKGHNIGYADTYKTTKPTEIGVVPVGYTDGFGVCRSNDTFRFRDMLRYILNDTLTCMRTKHLQVRAWNNSLNVLGRVGMYNIIVDITGTGLKVGDVVVLDINPLFCDSSIEREYI